MLIRIDSCVCPQCCVIKAKHHGLSLSRGALHCSWRALTCTHTQARSVCLCAYALFIKASFNHSAINPPSLTIRGILRMRRAPPTIDDVMHKWLYRVLNNSIVDGDSNVIFMLLNTLLFICPVKVLFILKLRKL